MRTQNLRWLAARASLCFFFFPVHTLCQSPAPKSAKPAARSSQWITHKDPQQYSVESPPGWTASPDKQKGWVRITGTQGEDVLIWPVFIPGAADPRFAPLIHVRLAAASPYNAQWETPQALTPSALRARGRSGSAVATSVFTWVSSSKGLAGFFYVVAAREPDYRQKQDDFVRILQSFRIMGAPKGEVVEDPGGVKYVRFSDPKEGAFTIDVPAGWKTEGGLFRFHAIDVRHSVGSDSPDGQIGILYGDPSVGLFTEPMPYFPEGSVYAPYGLKTKVQRFTPGAEFCRNWLLSTVSQHCPNLQVDDVRDLTDHLPKPAAGNPVAVLSTRATLGEASFHCGAQDQPKVGHCIAKTELMGKGWRVPLLTGYLSKPEKASMAEAINRHMAGSFRWNPEWEAMEARIAGDAARAVSGTANQIADMAAHSQRARNAIDDEIARRRSNATLGVVDVADPETGRRMTVESGSNYYWVDPRGVIVGTNTDTCPNVDFRALLQLP